METKNLIIVIVIVLILFLILNFKSSFGNVKEVSEVYTIRELYKLKFQKRFIKNTNKEIINGIDMVYVITMPQRKQYITNQINKLNTVCKYFDAVKPSDLTTAEYDRLSTTNDSRSSIFEKYTRLPVLLSFIMCYIDAIENEYDNIIVFEDDIKINTTLTTLNESIKEFIYSNLDIFYMGYCYLNCNQLLDLHKYRYLVETNDKNLLCCHAMCIKTKFLPGLIDYCFPMNLNSDELFRNYYILNNIKVCVPRTAYFIQNRETVESLNESVDDDLITCNFK